MYTQRWYYPDFFFYFILIFSVQLANLEVPRNVRSGPRARGGALHVEEKQRKVNVSALVIRGVLISLDHLIVTLISHTLK